MTKEKHIEVIALTELDILANDLNHHCVDLAENYCGGTSCLSCLAHALIDKGYRKDSDVAREIFEEIEKNMIVLTDSSLMNFRSVGARIFAELKKKYTEEGNDIKKINKKDF